MSTVPPPQSTTMYRHPTKESLVDLEGGGVTGVATPPPFQISKIKEGNKSKQKIEDNLLEKYEERKSCMFV